MKIIFKYIIWLIVHIIIGCSLIYSYLYYDNVLTDFFLFLILIYPLTGCIVTIIAIKQIFKDNILFKAGKNILILNLFAFSLFLYFVLSPLNNFGSTITTYAVIDKTVDQGDYSIIVFDSYFNTELKFPVDEIVYYEIEIHPNIEYTISYRYAEIGNNIYTNLSNFNSNHPVDNS